MSTTMPEAVRQSMAILARHRRLFGGGRAMAETDINRVIEAFDEAGAKWTLIGAHAVGVYTVPRATVDFDFIVEGKKLKTVVRAVERRFDDVGKQDISAGVRLLAIDVDLVSSTSHPLFARALKLSETRDRWRVPSAEVLVAMKFMSAVSETRRRERRMQDMTDLASVYLARRAAKFDRDLVAELAELVFPGGGKEIRDLFGKIDRGEPIAI